MELTVVQILGYLGGAGGVMACLILFVYQKDRRSSEKRMRDDRVFMEDRLTSIIEKDQESRENNTKAVTELTTLLRTLNGRIK